MLQRPLEMMALGYVVTAIEGPVHIAPCTCEEYACAQSTSCNIKGPVFHFQDEILKFLYNFSLESFRQRFTAGKTAIEVAAATPDLLSQPEVAS